MFEPSAQIDSLLAAVASRPAAAEAMHTMMARVSQFPSAAQAELAGIALDPAARAAADQFLDTFWSDELRRRALLSRGGAGREVIIGSGFHAAVYAAVRVLSGHDRPLVLEREQRAGGVFAVTAQPTFYLNSRNRAGRAGPAGDLGAAPNFLPGAPIQASAVSMREYQTNTDLAFVIRLTLAQFADVVTDAAVQSVAADGPGVKLILAGRAPLTAGRVIDARGVGDPDDQSLANGTTVLTFAQFLRRMAGRWPLRGLRRVAVIGGGDAGKCVVESLLGIGPQPAMAAAALDQVDRIDWYANTLPTTCQLWQQQVRSRYQAIGRHLRPDRFGVRRLHVLGRRVRPTGLPDAALVAGCAYDLAVLCTGNEETTLTGLEYDRFTPLQVGDDVVAREHDDLPIFRVGPHARLPLSEQERAAGIDARPGNEIAMFRLATKTAALAARLAAVPQQ